MVPAVQIPMSKVDRRQPEPMRVVYVDPKAYAVSEVEGCAAGVMGNENSDEAAQDVGAQERECSGDGQGGQEAAAKGGADVAHLVEEQVPM